MTMRSSPGTRAEMLPLVHATSSLRGSSAWSAHTSRRSAAIASVTDRRLLADPPQRVHDVVLAAAEVVVQRDVVLVEAVVDRGAGLPRLVDGAAPPAPPPPPGGGVPGPPRGGPGGPPPAPGP